MAIAIEPRKVLLLEMNELTWTILDPLIQQGKLPNFQRMIQEGARSAPEAIERPPYLDPWISWVTLHTGVDRTVHGAAVLGQDTVNAKRTWDYVVEAGKSVGVFGSISSHPPRPVPGFMVPGPFSPDNQAFPQYLSPALAFNRRYTQEHIKAAGKATLSEMVQQTRALLSLGVKPATLAKVAEQLVREKVDPHTHWKRVALQPQINFDVFAELYRSFAPDFATWHTGHCAHYEHHYWRAYDDSKFKVPATPEEKMHYGGAVEYGHLIADDLLGRFMRMADENTVVMVASGLGMKPYVVDMYPEGKICVRFKSVHRILDMFEAKGVGEVVPAMSPQWNIRIADSTERARVKALFGKAHVTGGPRKEAFHVAETGELLTVTPYGMAKLGHEIRYFFPDVPSADANGYLLDELFAADAPTPKEAMHDPPSVLTLWGPGIRAGVDIPNTTTLDIAPTILHMMGIPVPSIMKGRPLSEAWGEAPSAASSVTGDQGTTRAIHIAV